MNEEKVLLKVQEIRKNVKLTKITGMLLVILIAFFLPINFAYRFIIMFAVAVASQFIMRKIRLSSQDILYDECDPHTYYAVCHGIYPKDSTAYIDAITAYFIGDFDSAAGLVSSLLKKKARRFVRFEYLNLLAGVTFGAGDFDLCRQTVEELKALLSNIKMKSDVKNIYSARYDFFIHFMNCDYQSALESLEICKDLGAEKQKNTYKFMMCYYTAIALYYSNKTPQARAEFELITKLEPKIFVTEKAKSYINAIDNNEFLSLDCLSLKESCERAAVIPTINTENKRKLKLSIIILVICIAIAVVCFNEIPGVKRDTAYNVINDEVAVSEITDLITLDEDYSLAAFSTMEDEIGVAYLKNRNNNKYSYCISYTAKPEIYCENDDGYYITVEGKTEKVYFDITDNQKSIPEDSRITEFTHNGRTYYFYIFKTEKKFNFLNSCGVNLE